MENKCPSGKLHSQREAGTHLVFSIKNPWKQYRFFLGGGERKLNWKKLFGTYRSQDTLVQTVVGVWDQMKDVVI